jgi:RIO kinase 1
MDDDLKTLKEELNRGFQFATRNNSYVYHDESNEIDQDFHDNEYEDEDDHFDVDEEGNEFLSESNTSQGISAPLAKVGQNSSNSSSVGTSSSFFNAMSAPRSNPLKSEVAYQPKEHILDKYNDKINVGYLESFVASGVTKHTGRDDRATVEQVLDPRTRLILFKMVNSGFISCVNGCLSTGKEANVYHSESIDPVTRRVLEYAIKIYKTSILIFKDRDRYVSGEFRFRSGYSKSNPRKMVKLWAEKEARNLKRLHSVGIPVPRPLLLRLHVLTMEFVGKNGLAAPRLKDVSLSLEEMQLAYQKVIRLMRRMFQLCKLVHADLSEYNMLWYENEVIIIDVSQSVETDHPRALEFLRMDCTNVTDFFRKSNCIEKIASAKELFDYVVEQSNEKMKPFSFFHEGGPSYSSISEWLFSIPEEETYLQEAFNRSVAISKQQEFVLANSNEMKNMNEDEKVIVKNEFNIETKKDLELLAKQVAEKEISHAVFMDSFIPQRLSQVKNVEEEVIKLEKGLIREDELIHSKFTRISGIKGSEEKGNEEAMEGDDDDDDDDDDSSTSTSENPNLDSQKVYSVQTATKEERLAHKLQVKEAQRAKRKEKMSKKEKLKRIKATTKSR